MKELRITNRQEVRVKLSLFLFEGKVEAKNDDVNDLIQTEYTHIQNEYGTDKTPAKLERINAYLKSIQMNPNRYPHSAHALFKRIKKGKEFPAINNLVDLINLISIKTFCPVGIYDRDKIEGDLEIDLGDENTAFEALGGRAIKLVNTPLLRDKLGVFGSIVSDSERTAISSQSSKIMIVVYDFDEFQKQEELILTIAALIEKVSGSNVTTQNYYYEK